MIRVSILTGLKFDPELNALRNELLTIKGHSFIFPDLEVTNNLSEYYELVKSKINESDYIILLNEHKESNIFKILFGMAFQSDKKLKITSMNQLKKFIDDKGAKL